MKTTFTEITYTIFKTNQQSKKLDSTSKHLLKITLKHEKPISKSTIIFLLLFYLARGVG